MRSLPRSLWLAGLLVLIGCYPAAPPREAMTVSGPVERPRDLGLLLSDGVALPAGYGVLRLAITWPDPASRKTSIIPSDTNTLAIKVSEGATQLAYQEVARPQSSST